MALIGITIFGFIRPTALAAQADSVPSVVTVGLVALETQGIRQAVKVWFKGSALEHDTATVGSVIQQFDSLPAWLGHPYGHEIIRSYSIGSHVNRAYVILLLTGGPMYFRFEFYRSPQGWIVQHLDFNTDGSRVFPGSLLPP